MVFNSITSKDYAEEIKKATSGGVHAAAVFSNADAAYASAPSVIRLGGILMVIGLPHNNLQISSMDLALGKYRILPQVEFRRLDEVDSMVNDMRAGRATRRMAVVF